LFPLSSYRIWIAEHSKKQFAKDSQKGVECKVTRTDRGGAANQRIEIAAQS